MPAIPGDAACLLPVTRSILIPLRPRQRRSIPRRLGSPNRSCSVSTARSRSPHRSRDLSVPAERVADDHRPACFVNLTGAPIECAFLHSLCCASFCISLNVFILHTLRAICCFPRAVRVLRNTCFSLCHIVIGNVGHVGHRSDGSDHHRFDTDVPARRAHFNQKSDPTFPAPASR